MFKKSFALEFNGYSESIETKHIEDYDLWLKLGTVGKFANISTRTVSLMQRNDTISNKNRIIQAKRSINEISKFKSKYPNFFTSYLLNIIKLSFFLIQKIIPFNDIFMYKLRTTYKQY
jgi:hypothetical protein